MARANEKARQTSQEAMNRMQKEFERALQAQTEEIQRNQTQLLNQVQSVKEDTNRVTAGTEAGDTTGAVGGDTRGAVGSHTGSASSQTGAVSSQTGSVSSHTTAVSGQTAAVRSQTVAVSGHTGSVSGQTAAVSSHTAAVSGQTAAVSGQTGSASGGQIAPSTEAAPTAGERAATREPAPAESVRQTTAPLPALCQQYWTRNGCRKGACGQVHLCKLFLAGICKFGHMCRNEHSLQSEHNKVVCTEEASRSEEQLIAELRRRFAEEGFADQKFYRSHIEICPNQAESCRIHDCIRVHICRDCHRNLLTSRGLPI
ncbi:uncharacterized protein LOC122374144 [Amphibalanus amphitrite]|uniref:uncharacterized protein LOC122374144 n=1 Tax=Amphibalanus amphitrite TaxID=1232801 RepID=UPI001C90C293|nr:uncharacterized protein LOC122374144 [Amphibalanus amphitrite]